MTSNHRGVIMHTSRYAACDDDSAPLLMPEMNTDRSARDPDGEPELRSPTPPIPVLTPMETTAPCKSTGTDELLKRLPPKCRRKMLNNADHDYVDHEIPFGISKMLCVETDKMDETSEYDKDAVAVMKMDDIDLDDENGFYGWNCQESLVFENKKREFMSYTDEYESSMADDGETSTASYMDESIPEGSEASDENEMASDETEMECDELQEEVAASVLPDEDSGLKLTLSLAGSSNGEYKVKDMSSPIRSGSEELLRLQTKSRTASLTEVRGVANDEDGSTNSNQSVDNEVISNEDSKTTRKRRKSSNLAGKHSQKKRKKSNINIDSQRDQSIEHVENGCESHTESLPDKTEEKNNSRSIQMRRKSVHDVPPTQMRRKSVHDAWSVQERRKSVHDMETRRKSIQMHKEEQSNENEENPEVRKLSQEDKASKRNRGKSHTDATSRRKSLVNDTSDREDHREPGKHDSEETNEHDQPGLSMSMDDLKKKRRSSKVAERKKKGGRKLNRKKSNVDTNKVQDLYCWSCHHECDSSSLRCVNCPRIFHKKCCDQTNESTDIFECPECYAIEEAGKERLSINQEQLNAIFIHILEDVSRKKDAHHFCKPVDSTVFTAYLDYIKFPMDISLIRENVDNSVYKNPVQFLADFKWIVHNCTVFNTASSEITKVAKGLLKSFKKMLSEATICLECYYVYVAKDDKAFVELCKKPHLLIWAKMNKYPPWPAKLMIMKDNKMVDCRFFGDHQTGVIPLKECFAYSENPPASSVNKHDDSLNNSILEINRHIKLLEERYGEVKLFRNDTRLELRPVEEYLKAMLPNYDPNLPEEINTISGSTTDEELVHHEESDGGSQTLTSADIYPMQDQYNEPADKLQINSVEDQTPTNMDSTDEMPSLHPYDSDPEVESELLPKLSSSVDAEIQDSLKTGSANGTNQQDVEMNIDETSVSSESPKSGPPPVLEQPSAVEDKLVVKYSETEGNSNTTSEKQLAENVPDHNTDNNTSESIILKKLMEAPPKRQAILKVKNIESINASVTNSLAMAKTIIDDVNAVVTKSLEMVNNVTNIYASATCSHDYPANVTNLMNRSRSTGEVDLLQRLPSMASPLQRIMEDFGNGSRPNITVRAPSNINRAVGDDQLPASNTSHRPKNSPVTTSVITTGRPKNSPVMTPVPTGDYRSRNSSVTTPVPATDYRPRNSLVTTPVPATDYRSRNSPVTTSVPATDYRTNNSSVATPVLATDYRAKSSPVTTPVTSHRPKELVTSPTIGHRPKDIPVTTPITSHRSKNSPVTTPVIAKNIQNGTLSLQKAKSTTHSENKRANVDGSSIHDYVGEAVRKSGVTLSKSLSISVEPSQTAVPLTNGRAKFDSHFYKMVKDGQREIVKAVDTFRMSINTFVDTLVEKIDSLFSSVAQAYSVEVDNINEHHANEMMECRSLATSAAKYQCAAEFEAKIEDLKANLHCKCCSMKRSQQSINACVNTRGPINRSSKPKTTGKGSAVPAAIPIAKYSQNGTRFPVSYRLVDQFIHQSLPDQN